MDGLIFLSFLFPVSISSSAWTWFIPPLLLSGCLYLFFFVRLPLTALVCEDSGGRRMDVKVKVSQRKISFQTSKLQTELYSICVSKISTSQNDPCTDIYIKKKKIPFWGPICHEQRHMVQCHLLVKENFSASPPLQKKTRSQPVLSARLSFIWNAPLQQCLIGQNGKTDSKG